MKNGKTIEFKIERTIPAAPAEVFDAWLNPKIPGNPWNAAEKFLLDAKVDGLFYWRMKGTSTTADSPKSSDRPDFSIRGCHPTPWARNRR